MPETRSQGALIATEGMSKLIYFGGYVTVSQLIIVIGAQEEIIKNTILGGSSYLFVEGV